MDLFLLIKPGYFFGPDNIGLLGGLVAAAEQDNDFFPGVLVINAVAGAVMDAQFGDALAYRLNITGVAGSKAVNPLMDTGYGAIISKFFEPFVKHARSAHLLHNSSVNYSTHIVKRASCTLCDKNNDIFVDRL